MFFDHINNIFYVIHQGLMRYTLEFICYLLAFGQLQVTMGQLSRNYDHFNKKNIIITNSFLWGDIIRFSQEEKPKTRENK